jgi:hypothetical protein
MKDTYLESKIEVVVLNQDDILTASQPRTEILEIDKLELDSIDINDVKD